MCVCEREIDGVCIYVRVYTAEQYSRMIEREKE